MGRRPNTILTFGEDFVTSLLLTRAIRHLFTRACGSVGCLTRSITVTKTWRRVLFGTQIRLLLISEGASISPIMTFSTAFRKSWTQIAGSNSDQRSVEGLIERIRLIEFLQHHCLDILKATYWQFSQFCPKIRWNDQYHVMISVLVQGYTYSARFLLSYSQNWFLRDSLTSLRRGHWWRIGSGGLLLYNLYVRKAFLNARSFFWFRWGVCCGVIFTIVRLGLRNLRCGRLDCDKGSITDQIGRW